MHLWLKRGLRVASCSRHPLSFVFSGRSSQSIYCDWKTQFQSQEWWETYYQGMQLYELNDLRPFQWKVFVVRLVILEAVMFFRTVDGCPRLWLHQRFGQAPCPVKPMKVYRISYLTSLLPEAVSSAAWERWLKTIIKTPVMRVCDPMRGAIDNINSKRVFYLVILVNKWLHIHVFC